MELSWGVEEMEEGEGAWGEAEKARLRGRWRRRLFGGGWGGAGLDLELSCLEEKTATRRRIVLGRGIRRTCGWERVVCRHTRRDKERRKDWRGY
jgi:hypothetical protein